jgi:aminoglycoside/choline kinase family phosphotransferase
LQDARRDLARGLEQAMIARYADLAGCDPALLAPMVALLGAQRQIRILGVFTRLCLRDGKTGYLAHLPRVWRHLERNLAHPALAALADAVSTALPAPTPARIERIASLCATAAHR